jgi:DNA polymerase-4
MGAQRALGRRPKSPEEIYATLVALVDRLGGRLRGAGRVCRTVVLRLRFDDFSRATRSRTLPESTAHTQAILGAAADLLAAEMPVIRRRGITLLGISLSNLEDDSAVQLALPFERRLPGALDAAIDELRERYGSKAITRASLVGRDPGITPPLLPD